MKIALKKFQKLWQWILLENIVSRTHQCSSSDSLTPPFSMSGCVIRELLRTASSFGTREETMHRFISLIVTYSFYPISRPPYFVYHTQNNPCCLRLFVFVAFYFGKVRLRNRSKKKVVLGYFFL